MTRWSGWRQPFRRDAMGLIKTMPFSALQMHTKCKSTLSPFWPCEIQTQRQDLCCINLIRSSIKCRNRSPPRLWNPKLMSKVFRFEQRSGVSMQLKKPSSSGQGKNISFSLVLILNSFFRRLKTLSFEDWKLFLSQTEKKPTWRRRLWGDQSYREGCVWGGEPPP